jgi:hypothetical protein
MIKVYYNNVEHIIDYHSNIESNKLHRDNDLPAYIEKDNGYFVEKWYKNGELHRENDLPAIIDNEGMKYWFKNGKSHRTGDLPAMIDADGSKYWLRNGILHRDTDNPAEITMYRDNSADYGWRKNGNRHRDNDAPAFIATLYNKAISCRWYKNNKIHRDRDNPAEMDLLATPALPSVVDNNIIVNWWKNDKHYKKFELIKLKYLQVFIILIFICKTNKIIWSPKNLAGKFTKKQIYSLFINSG